MPTRSYYQKQAELLRNIAATTADPGQRQHLLRRASEYMDLAMGFPDDYVPPISQSAPQNAIGQQQQQIQPDKGEPETKE